MKRTYFWPYPKPKSLNASKGRMFQKNSKDIMLENRSLDIMQDFSWILTCVWLIVFILLVYAPGKGSTTHPQTIDSPCFLSLLRTGEGRPMALLNSLPKLPVLSYMTTTEESIVLKLMRQTHPAKMKSYTLQLYLLPSREQTYIPLGKMEHYLHMSRLLGDTSVPRRAMNIILNWFQKF